MPSMPRIMLAASLTTTFALTAPAEPAALDLKVPVTQGYVLGVDRNADGGNEISLPGTI
jgi:hypothetical protein